jgi:hypothetical protein
VGGGDPLADGVARDLAAHRTLRSAAVRDARLGLALRPLLAAALDGDDRLASFLPKACDAWQAVVAAERRPVR